MVALAGAFAKVNRANEHLGQLKLALADFVDGDAFPAYRTEVNRYSQEQSWQPVDPQAFLQVQKYAGPSGIREAGAGGWEVLTTIAELADVFMFVEKQIPQINWGVQVGDIIHKT